MLNELISWVLNTYLGKYLDNFNPTQLTIALLSGQVELENILIRKEALLNLGIPIEITYGIIGKIKLQIPICQFRSSPWCLALDMIQCVLRPKKTDDCDCCNTSSTLDENRMKVAAEEYTMELKQAESYYVNSYSNWLNFGTNLITKIVENLELKISNLYFRYEDENLINQCKFGFGLVINSLTGTNCNSVYTTGSAEEELVCFKKFELIDSSLFLDFKEIFQEKIQSSEDVFYILKPFSATVHCCRVTMTDKKINKEPKIWVEVNITNLDFRFSDIHFREIYYTVMKLNFLQLMPYFHSKRPTCRVSENPRLWWKYFAFCTGHEIKNENEIFKVMKENIKYLKLYVQFLRQRHQGISNDDRVYKIKFENSRSSFEVQQLREICYELIKDNSALSKSRKTENNRNLLFQWFPNWRGWYTTSDSNLESDSKNDNVESEILNAIETSFETENIFAKSYEYIHINILSNTGNISLGTGTFDLGFEKRLLLQIKNINFCLEFECYLKKIGCTIQSLILFDERNKTKQPISSITSDRIFSPNSEFERTAPQYRGLDRNAIYNILIQVNHLELVSENAIKLYCKGLEIFYNEDAFTWLLHFFYINDCYSVNARISAPFGRKNTIFMHFGQHVPLDMEISSSNLILHHMYHSSTSDVLFVSFGNVKLQRKPIRKNHESEMFNNDSFTEFTENDVYVTPSSTPPGSQNSFSESSAEHRNDMEQFAKNLNEELKRAIYKRMYRTYTLFVEYLNIFIGQNEIRNYFRANLNRRHALMNSSPISCQIDKRFIKTVDPSYPSLIVKSECSKMSFYINEKTINIIENNIRSYEENEIFTEAPTSFFEHCFHYMNGMELDFIFGQIVLELQSYNISLEMQLNSVTVKGQQSSDKMWINSTLQQVILFKVYEIHNQRKRTSIDKDVFNQIKPYVVNIFASPGLVQTFGLKKAEFDTTNFAVQLYLQVQKSVGQFLYTTLNVSLSNIDIKVNKEILTNLREMSHKLRQIYRCKKRNIEVQYAGSTKETWCSQCLSKISISCLNFCISSDSNLCKFFSHNGILNIKGWKLNIRFVPKTILYSSIKRFLLYNDTTMNDKLILSGGYEKNQLQTSYNEIYALKCEIIKAGTLLTLKIYANFLYYYVEEYCERILISWLKGTDEKIHVTTEGSMNQLWLEYFENMLLDIVFNEIKIVVPLSTPSDIFQINFRSIKIFNNEPYKEMVLLHGTERQKVLRVLMEKMNIVGKNELNSSKFYSIEIDNSGTSNEVFCTDIFMTRKTSCRKGSLNLCFKPIFEVHGSIEYLVIIEIFQSDLKKLNELFKKLTFSSIKPSLKELHIPRQYELMLRYHFNGICLILSEPNKNGKIKFFVKDFIVKINLYNYISVFQVLVASFKIDDQFVEKNMDYHFNVGLKLQVNRNVKSRSQISASCPNLSISKDDSKFRTFFNNCDKPQTKDLKLTSYDILYNSLTCLSFCDYYSNSNLRINCSKINVCLDSLFSVLKAVTSLTNCENGKDIKHSNESSTISASSHIRFEHLNLILIHQGRNIAKFMLNDCKMDINKLTSEYVFDGLIPSLSVIDLTNTGTMYSEKLLISRNNPLKIYIQQNLLQSTKDHKTNIKKYSVNINGSSILYVHAATFLTVLLEFLNSIKSKRIKLFIKKRTTNLKSTTELILDVSIQSSVIIFPINPLCGNVFVFDTGIIKIRNSDHEKCFTVNKYIVELDNFSGYVSTKLLKASNKTTTNDIYNLGSYVFLRSKGNFIDNVCGLKISVTYSSPWMKFTVVFPDIYFKFNTYNVTFIQSFLKGYNCLKVPKLKNETSSMHKTSTNFMIKLFFNNVTLFLNHMDYDILSISLSNAKLNIISYLDMRKDIFMSSKNLQIVASNGKSKILSNFIKDDVPQFEIIYRKTYDMEYYSMILKETQLIVFLDALIEINKFIKNCALTEISSTPEDSKSGIMYSTLKIVEKKMQLKLDCCELVFLEGRHFEENIAILEFNGNLLFHYNEFAMKCELNLQFLKVSISDLSKDSENELIIIDPFNIKCYTADNCIHVNVEENIFIRLSYTILKLVYKIFSNLYDSYSNLINCDRTPNRQSTTLKHAQRQNMFFSKSFRTEESNEISLFINLIFGMEGFNIVLPCMSIYFIDDCNEVNIPLLQFTFSKFILFQTFSTCKNICTVYGGNTNFSLEIGYYNRYLSGWEPLLEPFVGNITWKNIFTIINGKNEFYFCGKSNQSMELNLTTTLIELIDNVPYRWVYDIEKFKKSMSEKLKLPKKVPFQPLVLKNLTGRNLRFKIFVIQSAEITRTLPGQKIELSDWIHVARDGKIAFEFNTNMNQLHIFKIYEHQIYIDIEGWSLIGPISIEKVGTYFRYSISDNGKKTKIIIDIVSRDATQKMITIKSACTIFNKLECGIFLKMQNINSALILINARSIYSIPLEYIGSKLYIKPVSNRQEMDLYLESVSSSNYDQINFQDKVACIGYGFTTKDIICELINENNKKEILRCCGIGLQHFFIVAVLNTQSLTKDNISVCMRLKPPLRIFNCLCCDMKYCINGYIRGKITPSTSSDINFLNISDYFFLEVSIKNYKISGKLRISLCSVGIVESKIKLVDYQNRDLFLKVSIQTSDGISFRIFVTAPIWIINKTNLPLIFRQEGTIGILSGQFEEHEFESCKNTFMASFSDSEGTPNLEVRLGFALEKTDTWANSFCVQNSSTFRELKSNETKACYVIGIKVYRGRGCYAFTSFVQLTHRFHICNKTTFTLQFAQKCDIYSENSTITAKPGTSFPFHWRNYIYEKLLCVKISNVQYCHWSHGIPIQDMKSWFINVRNKFGEMCFLRLETISKGGVCLLLISSANSLPPPIRVENQSDILIYFSQVGSSPNWRTIVRPKSIVPYVFDDPLGSQNLNIEVPGGDSIELNVEKPETFIITYENFIYIIFKETLELNNSQQLVVGAKDKKVIIMKKRHGDRSQLWLLNSKQQLEHVGSSSSNELYSRTSSPNKRLVLDIEGSPKAFGISKLILRSPNKQRSSTQTWRLEDGRLTCLSNMCLQAKGGVAGLFEGNEVVLSQINLANSIRIPKHFIPNFQHIEVEHFRGGSGCLQIKSTMEGPVKVAKVVDIDDKSFISTGLRTLREKSGTQYSDKNQSAKVKNQYKVNINLIKGMGISIIGQYPPEEIAYISFDKIFIEFVTTQEHTTIDLKISNLQIDNQLVESKLPVVLKLYSDSAVPNATKTINLRATSLSCDLNNVFIFENISFDLTPCYLLLDEILILKIINFIRIRKTGMQDERLQKIDSDDLEELETTKNRRCYIGNFNISPMQVRVSALTASNLPKELLVVKSDIGLTLIKFEDAIIDFDKFSINEYFETLDVYINALKLHYINQVKWHAAAILGCVDFLGNPLGFASDLSEGVSGLIFEGSVKSLVKNIAHGISNSTAKLTESVSESLVKIILDERDNEARKKMLEKHSTTSFSHLTAGFKGFSFGLLGGVTSLVRNVYAGAQVDGIGGLVTGVGRGIIGTVTKPIIGVLDLASETASALRESSRPSIKNRSLRRRLPRCLNDSASSLLPIYSHLQSKGQHYLYQINKRNFAEKLIFYESNIFTYKATKLRLLISTQFVRVFSILESIPTITFQCHLSEILSCHAITSHEKNCTFKTDRVLYFIEISTNIPKITRPRIRCQTEDLSEQCSKYINYAKFIYAEQNQSFV